MPEAPDLVVIRDVLETRLVGQEVRGAQVLQPLVLRSMVTDDFNDDIIGCRFESIGRRGKFLLIGLSGDRGLVVNPMLTGALQYCTPKERVLKRVCLILDLDNGDQLRYLDEKKMGKVYYGNAEAVSQVPRLEDQGADVIDEALEVDEFTARLRPFRGEIKGVLTRGAFVSGIGNAYADEILWAAEISPFRKRTQLTPDETQRLHDAVYAVPARAVRTLRDRMGDNVHVKIRDFLMVHGKTGQPCPRCGHDISSITANQRLTNYCRICQPGMLIRN